MAKPKLHREPLDLELSDALLAAIHPGTGKTIAISLREARAELDSAIQAAVGDLEKNPLVKIVAAATAKKLGRKGDARLVMGQDGTLLLEVLQKGTEPMMTTTVAGPTTKRAWVSDLPSLEMLRKEAVTLGVAIDELGRSKKLLMTAIQNCKAHL